GNHCAALADIIAGDDVARAGDARRDGVAHGHGEMADGAVAGFIEGSARDRGRADGELTPGIHRAKDNEVPRAGTIVRGGGGVGGSASRGASAFKGLIGGTDNQTLECTSPSGSAATYAATATDNCSSPGNLVVFCSEF